MSDKKAEMLVVMRKRDFFSPEFKYRHCYSQNNGLEMLNNLRQLWTLKIVEPQTTDNMFSTYSFQTRLSQRLT